MHCAHVSQRLALDVPVLHRHCHGKLPLVKLQRQLVLAQRPPRRAELAARMTLAMIVTRRHHDGLVLLEGLESALEQAHPSKGCAEVAEDHRRLFGALLAQGPRHCQALAADAHNSLPVARRRELLHALDHLRGLGRPRGGAARGCALLQLRALIAVPGLPMRQLTRARAVAHAGAGRALQHRRRELCPALLQGAAPHFSKCVLRLQTASFRVCPVRSVN